MNSRKLIVLLAAMWVPTLVCAGDKIVHSDPIKVQVQVDSQGHVGDIHPMHAVKEPFASLLQTTLSGWRFHPAVLDGTPVATTTWLTVELVSRPNASGSYSVHVQYDGNGPYLVGGVPRYPTDMLRQGRDANIVVFATFGKDGTLSDLRVGQAETSDGGPAAEFVHAVFDSLHRAQVHPIVVDGHPVASRIRFPVTFRLDRTADAKGDIPNLKPASDRSRFPGPTDVPAGMVGSPEGVALALDSPVTPMNLPGG